jgi:aryl-alcohol dehydrogenase-like predicted oxidoreductase
VRRVGTFKSNNTFCSLSPPISTSLTWFVTRVGYGAMQLAGPGVFGPPKDRDAAIGVLRKAVDLGITHIDTSDFYGPHVTNQIIKEALHPYRDDLHIVTKVGARRDAEGGWPHALAPDELRESRPRQPEESRPRRARRRKPSHRSD